MFATLLYHGIEGGERSARVMDDVDREYVLDRDRFDAHVAYLASTPPSAVRVVISFDDGDSSGFTIAAPVLERHDLRGEFFVVTRWIGRPGFMSADQLRDLVRRGHGVQSHSRTHPRLSGLAVPQIEDELKGSKADLEALLGREVTQLSIPGGAYDERVVDIARQAGYARVLNSVEGYNDETGDAFVLRRFTPRAYSDVSMLKDICERPRYTSARLAVKRAVLSSARGLMGANGYDALRRKAIEALKARP